MLSRKSVFSAVLVMLFAGIMASAEDLTLVVSADSPNLTVIPDALFFRQLTATPPAPQTVAISARGATLGTFTAVATSTGNWLSVSPGSGSGATTLTVSVNTSALGAGEYTGSIAINATGFRIATVKVELQILNTTIQPGSTTATPPSVVILRPDNLEFHAVEGGSAPAPRQLVIFNPAGDNFSWTATSTMSTPPLGKWLGISASAGTGKGVLTVKADPTGLAAGRYDGVINVTSSGTTASTRVRLTVDAAQTAKLIVVPQALNFNIEPNATRPPETRTIEVRTAGHGDARDDRGQGRGAPPSTQWTASVVVDKPTNGTWLAITPTSGKTPDRITVKVTPTGLAAGTYSGKIIVKSGTDSSNVLVYLRILGPSKPAAIVSPRELRFTATTGATGVVSPASRVINIRSTATGLNFSATATTSKGGAWLAITPLSGAVPGTITASVSAAIATKLAPGFYTGAIEVKVPGTQKELTTVHVRLKVFTPEEKTRLDVEPGGLSFSATLGGADPAAKPVKLVPEGVASLVWSATVTVATPTGGTWLSVTPTSGTTTAAANSTVNVSAKIAGLAVGTYHGTVVFTPDPASGAPAAHLNVVLVIAPTGTARPTSLFVSDAELGGAAIAPGELTAFFSGPNDGFVSDLASPPGLAVTVLDSTGAPVEGATVTISSSNGEPDLILADVGGGAYEGVFRALSSGPVTLTGVAVVGTQSSAAFGISGELQSSPDQPTIIFQDGAVSAASFAASPAPLAPGSLVSLFGKNLAGNGGAAGSLPLPKSLGNVSVTIGGVPAPLLSADPNSDQINLQVPFELDGQASAEIVVNNNGVLSAPETIQIAAAPALFTLSSTGTGPGAFLHGTSGTVISSSNPAAANEVIVLYATGLGAVLPAVASGEATADPTAVSGNVSVTIGGRLAEVQYSGLAPNFVGLYQINVVVPAGIAASDALVVLSVDGTPATGQATVALR